MKRAAQSQEQAEAEAYAERALAVDRMKTELEATARAARTSTNVAVAEYQLAQAEAKRARERSAQQAELQDNIEEIQNNLAGDVLTENPAVGRSYMSANRVRPDHYKGMSPAEQQAILEAQEAQRLQNLAKSAQAKTDDAAADAAMEFTRRQGAYQDAQVAAMRAETRKVSHKPLSINPRWSRRICAPCLPASRGALAFSISPHPPPFLTPNRS